jgi:hypothetical protein
MMLFQRNVQRKIESIQIQFWPQDDLVISQTENWMSEQTREASQKKREVLPIHQQE